MSTTIISKTIPVTLAEAKSQLRMSEAFTDDNPLITGLIGVAVQEASNYIENPIALTEFQTTFKNFKGDIIEVNKGNYVSIVKIEYVDSEGTTKEVSGHEVESDEFGFRVCLRNPLEAEGLTITYKCGFTNLSIPAVIKQAILIKVTDLYDIERASYVSTNIRKTNVFENLLNYHKRLC